MRQVPSSTLLRLEEAGREKKIFSLENHQQKHSHRKTHSKEKEKDEKRKNILNSEHNTTKQTEKRRT